MHIKMQYGFILLQAITIFRAVAALVFICIALTPAFHSASIALYLYCIISDFVDGKIARRYNMSTRLGEALDLFGDKYLTIVSCMYVWFRGVDILPLAIIILRDIFSISMRMIQDNGKRIMGTNKIIGGVIALILWGATFLLLVDTDINPSLKIEFNAPYYAVAIFYIFYVAYRLCTSFSDLKQCVTHDLERL